jgi:sugar lactone lactonase YvrE
VEYFGQKIGRITTGGVITEFSLPGGSYPFGITAGADGNLWFVERFGNNVGRITTAGAITEFPIPTSGSQPFKITAGPDGNLWFTEDFGNNIGRITTAGVISEFSIPTAGSAPGGITAGPDGNLWFAEITGNKIGRISTGGVFAEFLVPTGGSQPWLIRTGPDGNMWFSEDSAANQIGRITPAGVITEFAAPTPNSRPNGVTTGPDGNLWFTEGNADKVVKAHIGPLYNVCLLYDPTKAVKSGATIPIKLQLCDANGGNLSSSSIVVHATTLTMVSTSISGQVQDAGNANPDNDFRYDATLGGTGGYIFNLSTKGLTTGTYQLNFQAGSDPVPHAAPFQVQ